ncbi:hypothetical protein AA23498_1215 [Acetobacter nitrogenifigens DSM 23921 = NBRC 105050]|uniref:Endonuclease/exonuclease/phosphatase domain-containing protein n=1 Tax=Acetobacter nitrogenifigens DSM 23921 = NBRC 105050 TaxID=1120919 RepID=A0A511XCZ4_9PROT|nr:hypothetical protein [Acetobacter nitrogenifigens]GBQ91550.1 hypothetical protein AA23498_1215 [Acetobacter nitrogenifigens DSM 23921 = NBRC 105050]GEN60834.1 hypothetical protein ANI02nite_27180 [Acetobacter nitrogenifigens DSM 23921 = NBRC 105050]
MPIIAYQSFNANARTVVPFNYDSMLNQHFTRNTNDKVTQGKHYSLQLPVTPDNCMSEAVIGPANLVRVKKLPAASSRRIAKEKAQPRAIFGEHVAQIWQNCIRRMGQLKPDILVCGELYAPANLPTRNAAVSPDSQIATRAFKSLNPEKPNSYYRSCNTFTAFSEVGARSQEVASGYGFVVYKLDDLIVAFVHVPNDKCDNEQAMVTFYKGVAQAAKSVFLDVVVGDTNQPSPDFTRRVLNIAFGEKQQYTNAMAADIEARRLTTIDTLVSDGDPRNGGSVSPAVRAGTNSNSQEMYDVAVFRGAAVGVVDAFYISQSATGVTVTDHCGICVNFSKKVYGNATAPRQPLKRTLSQQNGAAKRFKPNNGSCRS